METAMEVELNYKKAMSHVEQLTSLAKSLEKVGNSQISDCMKEITANWESDNSVKYVDKGNQLMAKIEMSARNIRCFADALGAKAEDIRK